VGKYANHNEFGANAPINYREDTTSGSFMEGMTRIAPPGMKPKTTRGHRFEEKTDFKASVRWHRNYDTAMFGGTDIALPNSETKQRGMEALIDHIERRPGRA
jgi:hypothetical protein